ncbi:uncharacterized protein [Saccopteryx bilineata]|uniref:uncharacterized protein n=1 Tax=Saccopteryx bilineata TaxID=59482 RepID=UPI00338EB7F3
MRTAWPAPRPLTAAPAPRSPARTLPPIPGWSRVPTPHPRREARALPLAGLAPPFPAPPRVTQGNRSAAAPELCACVPLTRPSLPTVRSPAPPQLREPGASPPPGQVSIDRPPPPRRADTDPPPRRRLGRPPRLHGLAPLPACTAASASVRAGEMRSAGGAH